jgi:hypothetical protein
MEKDKFPASPCRKGIRVMAFPQIMRKPWSVEEVLQLRKLVKQNTPAQVIARKLGRSRVRFLCQSFSREDFSEACAEFPVIVERRKRSILLRIVVALKLSSSSLGSFLLIGRE